MTQADEIEERIKEVFGDVFSLPADQVGPETSQDTVDGWDSLQHLTLVIALEEEFDIHFDDEETVTLVTFPLILSIVSDHVSGTAPA